MRIEPEIGSCSIVLLGHFNPLIFSPLWFVRNGLISEEQGAAAEVKIIHEDVALLKIGKIQMQVEATRFTADTAEAPWVDLCDFVAKTFAEFLVHTPINQLGINRLVHFSVGSEERRNRIGNILAPLDPWGEWGKAMAASPPDIRGGCVNLTMQLSRKEEDHKGHIQISVQPSARIKGNAGLYAQTNDHYSVGPLEDVIGCDKIMGLLINNFERSVEQSEQLIDQIMSLGE